ncbi:hypothetical protein H072_2885 [Dactylellina haptotyla CBS 200.50]|uniref:Uncharacterized protein n=1 Tax=Dactylellina haptotyla (strain CBS 200.50) TaxID=1284197 RepID=S8APM5_DACHA|nr:hypothetical protein H072_2885 [Dactylellina haptotyla CBS 200.50]
MKFFTLATIFAAASAVSGSQLKYQNIYNSAYSLDLNSASCSNGPNGLVTKYGTQNSQQFRTKLKPGVYVAAAQAPWGSPKCGLCWKLVGTKSQRSAYFVTVDNSAPTIVGGEDMFKALSPSKTLFEGVIEVWAYQRPQSECFK